MKKTQPTHMMAVFAAAFVILSGCTKTEQQSNPGATSLNSLEGKSNSAYYKGTVLINTFAGNGSPGYSGDGGPAVNAMLNAPENICIDRKGYAYVVDLGNAVIRRIDIGTGRITTVAGNGIMGFSGDNGPATQASFAYPFHSATDEEGNLYISDLANNRIRKVDARSGIITTIAGTGIKGYNGDGMNALSTNLSEPFGIAFNKSGDLLIVDEDGLRLRKMNMKTKIISTVAGYGVRGYAGDGGPASQAMFDFIWSIAVDKQSGDIFVTDAANHRIRRIDHGSGVISTFAGTGQPGNNGSDGPALQASFTNATGIAVDNLGNVFFSDETLSQVYMVEKRTGVIHRIAGLGFNGFSGDGGLAIQALLAHPNSLSVDDKGQVYVCDSYNNRIRKIFRQGE